MPFVKYLRVVGGPLKTNSYIIYSGGEGIVIDPGVGADRLVRAIREAGVTEVRYILLTHGHFDHVYFASEVSEALGAKVLIHPSDIGIMRSSGIWGTPLYGRRFQPPEEVEPVSDGQVVRAGELEARIIHTPGHTPGSICAIIDKLLVTGDTLFKGTVGATFFPGGSREKLQSSLEKLARLPGDYTVLPGHGDETSLERERRENPFLRALLHG